jgi:peptidoglycan/LPS O-acetylase OafA/YrhL
MNIKSLLERDNNNLDLIRIVLSSLVIIYHSFALNPSWGLKDPTLTHLKDISTGGISVKIFFFISGLLVTNSLIRNKSPFAFIISRFLRVFPGLIAVVLIAAIIVGPLVSSVGIIEYIKDAKTLDYVIKNILMDTQYVLPGVSFTNHYDSLNGSIWTIKFEVLYYIILALLFPIIIFYRGVGASIFCVSIIVYPLFPFDQSLLGPVPLLPQCFCFGALYALNSEVFKSNLITPMVLFLISFIFRDNLYVYTVTLSFGFSLLALHISSCKVIRSLHIKNDISYGVYLWGFPVQQILSEYTSLSPFFGILMALLVSYSIGHASWILVERPGILASKQLSAKIKNLSWKNKEKKAG